MSTSERVVRPFAGSAALDEFLMGARLLVGTEYVTAGGRRHLSDGDYLSDPVGVDFGSVSTRREALIALEAEGEYSTADLEVVILATSPFLKIAEVLHRRPITDLLMDNDGTCSFTGEERPAALRAYKSGCTISAYVCLARALDPKPLSAWRRATWIAMTDWRLSTQAGAVGFVPLPLTDAVRQAEQLPAGTLRFLRIDESPAHLDTDVALEFYVDEVVLRDLNVDPRSARSIALQRQLFVDAIGVIAGAFRADEELAHYTWPEVERTLIGSVIEAVSGSKPTTPPAERVQRNTALLKMLQDQNSGLARFMGYVEATADILGATKAMLAVES